MELKATGNAWGLRYICKYNLEAGAIVTEIIVEAAVRAGSPDTQAQRIFQRQGPGLYVAKIEDGAFSRRQVQAVVGAAGVLLGITDKPAWDENGIELEAVDGRTAFIADPDGYL